MRNRTDIENEMFYNGLHATFQTAIYPLVKDNLSKLLEFSMMIKPFSPGETFDVDEYLRYGVDEKGFPIIYKSLQNHVAQSNILPNGEHSANRYEKVGYYNDVRVWVKPSGADSSYALDEIVPDISTVEHEAITYSMGATVYKDDYIITPDNLVYQVVPNQIVMNTDAVPFTNTSVYSVVPEATVINATTVGLSGYAMFKSLVNDNRFSTDIAQVWERIV